MKKKKILIISSIPIILSFCFITFKIFADLEDAYNIYQDRVNRICWQYKPWKPIFQTKNYEKLVEKNKTISNNNSIIKNLPIVQFFDNEVKEQVGTITIWDPIENAKEIYKENMNNLYKCMILNAQKSSYNLLLLEIKDNQELSKTFWKEINDKQRKLELTITKTKCNSIDSNNSINKLDYLTQTTYELCKYHSYLEYLKIYNSNYTNFIDNKEEIDISILKNMQEQKINEIDKEIKHVYKVFPLAFNAYKQYEDNLTTHLLLELIKKDYIALRENLHNSLNPINQVIYKIANAMKK